MRVNRTDEYENVQRVIMRSVIFSFSFAYSVPEKWFNSGCDESALDVHAVCKILKVYAQQPDNGTLIYSIKI